MACDQSEIRIEEGRLDNPEVRALLDLHFAELRADSPPEACHVLPAQSLRSPNIRFFAARDGGGELLGVGALQALEPGHGEIKSMRTAKAALGRGVGRAILDQLIAEARTEGMTKLSLETGNSPLFDAANRLYLGAGFVRCGPFGCYKPTDFTHFYTRSI
ncbi:MAG: GNAT family N-acetyltransferase [Sphingomicrobium sp.]